MSQPMELDEIKVVSPGVLALAAWDSVVGSLVALISSELGRMVHPEAVEEYLREELGIEDPRDADFALEDAEDVDDYIASLTQADYRDAYRYSVAGPESDGSVHADDEDAVVEEEHYSSEDDETPIRPKQFDRVVAVAQYLNRWLEAEMHRSPSLPAYRERIAEVVERIEQFKANNPQKAYPANFNPIPIAGAADWSAFVVAVREAIAAARTRGSRVKPTAYEIVFDVWPGATYRTVAFRGIKLMQPNGKQGQSWPKIAMALHRLAELIGTSVAAGQDATLCQAVGTRVLAAALLWVLSGRGEEVHTVLRESGFTADAEFEATVLEFLALSMGIEAVRLPYAHLDLLFHLALMVKGRGFGQHDKRYDFLTVFSSVRQFTTGRRHVYVRGSYDKRGKEITEYRGFEVTDLDKATMGRWLAKPTRKSGKSVGKSVFSHNAGHGRVKALLAKDMLVTEELWRQVRPVTGQENRREVHTQRLHCMGPVRVYNLISNVLRTDKVKSMRHSQIGAHLADACRCFLTGTRPSPENVFADLFPTASFQTTVLSILDSEQALQVADQTAYDLFNALTVGDYGKFMQLLKRAGKDSRAVLARMYGRKLRWRGEGLLHHAIRMGSTELTTTLLTMGADPFEESADGVTPLALAIACNQGELAKLVLAAQDRQRDRRSVLDIESPWSHLDLMVGDEWLTDTEVRMLLQAQQLGPQVHVTAAVDLVAHPEVLAGFIRDNYLWQMVQQQGICQYTIVPVNFHNAHWAALVIEQNPHRRSAPAAYFFDSVGSNDHKKSLIETLLRMTGVYTRATVVDVSVRVQQDPRTCGTWLVLAATTIVRMLAQGHSTDQIKNGLVAPVQNIDETHRKNLVKVRTKQ